MIDLLFEGEQAHQIKTIGNRHPTYTYIIQYCTQANVFLNPFLLLELFMQVRSSFTNSQIPRTTVYSGLQSLARSSLTSHQNYCILRTSPWLEAVLQVIRTTVLTVILYCTSPWLAVALFLYLLYTVQYTQDLQRTLSQRYVNRFSQI